MAKYKPYYHQESGILFKDFQQVREYIWNTREHKSQLTGEPLLHKGHMLWINQFLHILNRHHASWVLNPDNVLLGLPHEHDKQESYQVFRDKLEEMKMKYHQENQVKKWQ